jgi:hypothetical protein
VGRPQASPVRDNKRGSAGALPYSPLPLYPLNPIDVCDTLQEIAILTSILNEEIG